MSGMYEHQKVRNTTPVTIRASDGRGAAAASDTVDVSVMKGRPRVNVAGSVTRPDPQVAMGSPGLPPKFAIAGSADMPAHDRSWQFLRSIIALFYRATTPASRGVCTMARFLAPTALIAVISAQVACVPPYERTAHDDSTHAHLRRGQFSVDTMAVHYVEGGNRQGPRVFFIHGTPGNWEAFAHLMRDRTLLDRLHLIAIDRPGFGASAHAGVITDLDRHAAVVHAAFKAVGNPENKPIVVAIRSAARSRISLPQIIQRISADSSQSRQVSTRRSARRDGSIIWGHGPGPSFRVRSNARIRRSCRSVSNSARYIIDCPASRGRLWSSRAGSTGWFRLATQISRSAT